MKEQLFHLRPTFRMRYRPVGGLLEVAPWINAVLLLMMFFMAMSGTMKKPGLMIELPVAASNAGARYDASMLSITRDGRYFFDDERMGREQLAYRLRDAARARPGGELIIEADSALSHQEAMDMFNIASEAGWKKILVATRPSSSAASSP